MLASTNAMTSMLIMNAAHHQELAKLDLNLLTVFDALLRECSVTRAGAELGLTQSAMSHSLGRLRQFFDDPLFVKAHRGMQPTTKAEALRPVVHEVMTTIRDQLLSQARFDPAQARRTFTLCLSDMGELVFLPTLLDDLKQTAPLCSLRTVQMPPQQMANALATGEADLALSSLRSAPEGLYQQQLFAHSFVTIASLRNPHIGERLTLEEFTRLPHVTVTLTGNSNIPYDAAIEEYGISRRILVSTPHFLFVPLLMEQHPELIATVPLALGSVFARLGSVRLLQPPLRMPPFSLHQYWHPRFHHDRANVWLRQRVKALFPGLPSSLEAPGFPNHASHT